ncbi:hypothetical protein [Pusillimonas noertemannii]|uniref:Uncharacterized protein n=1 Tax=Pusillimonas noertemannii TaxID=305977 RepID=A0A2U1CMJ6_9BURK|nr:hypothetical protein [Pusillimonas noertemannii]NYT68752.1 hypothetical protein [Pusillimonas noertemannii]PVY62227.1 hypothetical protein C7440_1720 [Pusillimonas noertemannii]TFL10793.1 hypothetical protein CSC72_09765 [Pusillimonas noertemannii]
MKEYSIRLPGDIVRSIIDGDRTSLIHPAAPPALKCPFGQVGQPIWVKETYTPMHEGVTTREGIAYRADFLDDPHGPDGELSREGKYRFWKPSSTMPKWASRLILYPTRIRAMTLSAVAKEDGYGEDLISPEPKIPPTGSLFESEPEDDPLVWAVDFTKELLKP